MNTLYFRYMNKLSQAVPHTGEWRALKNIVRWVNSIKYISYIRDNVETALNAHFALLRNDQDVKADADLVQYNQEQIAVYNEFLAFTKDYRQAEY